MHLPWESFGTTHRGNLRDHNEDAFLALPAQKLWLAADGIGGHHAGDLASTLIVDRFQAYRATPFFGHNMQQVFSILNGVNNEIYSQAQQLGDVIIGSTVVVLVAGEQSIVVAWSGDSRIYRLRKGAFKQITRDHSEAADPDFAQFDSPGAVNTNAISQAIGVSETLEIEFEMRESQPGDIYLLCSDGLNKELSDKKIATVLEGKAVEDSGKELLRLALDNEGRDNITVVLARHPTAVP